ncbi:hypothetical protein DUI87_17110 [Hirundo rustica rustica]|uniref:Uncharacterized protein n=1 Tax=Hirundo rustica rustica TaxID=333673 RepID=A0A3M0K8G6_HIRRU|nr:hypothetical protein DUI87_17110 [Hirundo rustica rustica]
MITGMEHLSCQESLGESVVSSTMWPPSNYIYCLKKNSWQFTEGSACTGLCWHYQILPLTWVFHTVASIPVFLIDQDTASPVFSHLLSDGYSLSTKNTLVASSALLWPLLNAETAQCAADFVFLFILNLNFIFVVASPPKDLDLKDPEHNVPTQKMSQQELRRSDPKRTCGDVAFSVHE